MAGATDDVVVPVEIAQKYALGGATLLGRTGARYRGRDASNGREVVAVTLRYASFDSTAERLRVRRELDALVKVREPGVAPVLASGETPAGLWYVREWVAGESLSARMARMGALAPRVAAHIARGINTALGRLHARRIMHRGIQPTAVVLGTDDAVTLVDAALGPPFSNAAHHADEGRAFLAPEVAAGRLAGISSDLYGLGVTLVAMLTGRAPEPDALVGDGDTAPPGVSAPLDRVVAQLIARESRRRPATTRQLEASLAAIAPVLGSTRDSVVTAVSRLRPSAAGAAPIAPLAQPPATSAVPQLPGDGADAEGEDEPTDIAKDAWLAPPPPSPAAAARNADEVLAESETEPRRSAGPSPRAVAPRPVDAGSSTASAAPADDVEDEPTDVAPRNGPPPGTVDEVPTEPAALPLEEPTTPRERDASWPSAAAPSSLSSSSSSSSSGTRPPVPPVVTAAPLPPRLPPPPPPVSAAPRAGASAPSAHGADADVDETGEPSEVPTTVSPHVPLARATGPAPRAAGERSSHDDDFGAPSSLPLAPAAPSPTRAPTPLPATRPRVVTNSVARAPAATASSLPPAVASVPPRDGTPPASLHPGRVARVARRAFWAGVLVGAAGMALTVAGVFAVRAALRPEAHAAAAHASTATTDRAAAVAPASTAGAHARPRAGGAAVPESSAAAPSSSSPRPARVATDPAAASAPSPARDAAPSQQPAAVAATAAPHSGAHAVEAPPAPAPAAATPSACGPEARRGTPLAHPQQALAAGDNDEARRALQRLLPHMPNVWQLHCMLAEVHLRTGERAAAARELRVAVQHASRNVPALRRLAAIQASAHDRDGEIATLESVLRLDRRDAASRERLASLRMPTTRRRR